MFFVKPIFAVGDKTGSIPIILYSFLYVQSKRFAAKVKSRNRDAMLAEFWQIKNMAVRQGWSYNVSAHLHTLFIKNNEHLFAAHTQKTKIPRKKLSSRNHRTPPPTNCKRFLLKGVWPQKVSKNSFEERWEDSFTQKPTRKAQGQWWPFSITFINPSLFKAKATTFWVPSQLRFRVLLITTVSNFTLATKSDEYDI